MSNSWSLLRLCGPRTRKQFGNAAFLIVLPHNSHHHITVEMLSTTFPQVITHEKVLVDCEDDLNHFLKTMDALEDKLGPLLFQFGYFNKTKFKSGAEFLALLKPFLKKLPKGYKFAVEIRNKNWLDLRFVDLLREHGVALALIDQGWMPRPWEMKSDLDLITADFTYVRWLGDRKGIEEKTKTWDKIIVDRRGDLLEWVELLKKLWTK